MSARGCDEVGIGAQYVADVTELVASVLAAHGHEAGQYSVLGPDRWQVVWNPERTGFAAFLEGRHCLVQWRSPVAADEDQPEVMARLLNHARSVGKTLFALEVNEISCRAGVALGMRPIWMGCEAYLDLATWSLEGGRRMKLRWGRGVAVRAGYHWREAFPLADAADRVSLERLERIWKEERPERFTDSFLRTSFMEMASLRRYVVCEGPDGVVASTTAMPVNGRGWYLQDLVRAPDAPRGALEGAMILALDTLRDEGFEFASIGPLPFWHPEGQSEDMYRLGPIGNRIMRTFDQRFQFRNINMFRTKFKPDRVSSLYVLRSGRVIAPGAARSLTRVLSHRVT